MSFRRLRNPFAIIEWGGVTFKGTDILLINGLSHYGQIVKMGSRYSKTEYTHVYPDHILVALIWEATEPITRGELIKLRHHFTRRIDRKSTRLNSSHTVISYAVFCLKKKKMTYS